MVRKFLAGFVGAISKQGALAFYDLVFHLLSELSECGFRKVDRGQVPQALKCAQPSVVGDDECMIGCVAVLSVIFEISLFRRVPQDHLARGVRHRLSASSGIRGLDRIHSRATSSR